MSDDTVEQTAVDPTKVEQMNPYFSEQYRDLKGQLGASQQQAGGFLESMAQYSPEGLGNYLLGQMPAYQGIIGQLIDPYSQAGLSSAAQQAQTAQRSISGGATAANSLFSGAFAQALGEGVTRPYTDLATNIAGMQAQLGGGLLGGAQTQYGAAADRYAGLYGTQLGYQSALNQYLTQKTMPEYVLPYAAEGSSFGGGGLSQAQSDLAAASSAIESARRR